MTRNPAAVIFDLDGCLVDSEPLAITAITDEMREMGIENVTFDDIRSRFLGVSMRVICEFIADKIGKDVGAEFVDRFEARLFDTYRTQLRQIEGATDLLAALKAAGIPMAIGTGGSVKRMTYTLETVGLADWFKGTGFSADQVTHGKPAPDLFLLAADRLGVDPAECVVIEDSPHGIQAAVSAGMRGIGFVGGSHLDGIRDTHARLLDTKGAATVARTMTQVIRAILPDA